MANNNTPPYPWNPFGGFSGQLPEGWMEFGDSGKPKEKPGDPAKPVACIMADEGTQTCWCGRTAASGEHTFKDAKHAVLFYKLKPSEKGLRVCPDCAREWEIVHGESGVRP